MLESVIVCGAWIALVAASYRSAWSAGVVLGAPVVMISADWLAQADSWNAWGGVHLVGPVWLGAALVAASVLGASAATEPAPRRLVMFGLTTALVLTLAWSSTSAVEVLGIWLVSALASARRVVFGRAADPRDEVGLTLACLLGGAFAGGAVFATPDQWPVAGVLLVHLAGAAWGHLRPDPMFAVGGAVIAVTVALSHAIRQAGPIGAELEARWEGAWDGLPVTELGVFESGDGLALRADRAVPPGADRLLVRHDSAWPPSSRVGTVRLYPTEVPVNLRLVGGGVGERLDGSRSVIADLPQDESWVIEPTGASAADVAALCAGRGCGAPAGEDRPDTWRDERGWMLARFLVGFGGLVALGFAYVRDPRRSWGVVAAVAGLGVVQHGGDALPAAALTLAVVGALHHASGVGGWRERAVAVALLAAPGVTSAALSPALGPTAWHIGWVCALIGLPVALLAGTRAVHLRAVFALLYLAWIGWASVTLFDRVGAAWSIPLAIAAVVVVGPVLRSLLRVGAYRSFDGVALGLLAVCAVNVFGLRTSPAEVRLDRVDREHPLPRVGWQWIDPRPPSWCALLVTSPQRVEDLETGLPCAVPQVAVVPAEVPATAALGLPASVEWFAVVTPSASPRDRYAVVWLPPFDPSFPVPLCPLDGHTFGEAIAACEGDLRSRGVPGVAGVPAVDLGAVPR